MGGHPQQSRSPLLTFDKVRPLPRRVRRGIGTGRDRLLNMMPQVGVLAVDGYLTILSPPNKQ